MSWTKCENTHFTHPRDVPSPVRYSVWQMHNIHLFSTEEYNHTIYETLMLLDSRRHLENYATHTRHSHLSNTRTNVCCQKHYETRTTITNGCTKPNACDWTYGKHLTSTWVILQTLTMFRFQFLCIQLKSRN